MNWILAKILIEKDLDTWSKLKAQFFSSPYNKIYSVITKFYDKHGKLPTFEDLEISVRDKRLLSSIKALKEVELPDIDNDIVFEALIDDYAQNKALDRLDNFIETVAFKDSVEIVNELNEIAITIEEETENEEHVMLMNDYMTIDQKELHARVPLGISNDLDNFSMGFALSEFVMMGGYRGSGKSIICSNVACNQFELGNTSLYFSIEMRGREIYERNLGILSGVPVKNIRLGNLSDEERRKIAKVRAEMTKDGSKDLLDKFYENGNLEEFESKLIQRPLSDAKLVTIDNPVINLMHIDAMVSKYKNVYQDKLTVVIVDYINQISEKDAYRWDNQIEIAKKLKAIARKNEVVMLSPYQISEDGTVRFSKGLLDAPDWAWNMTAKKVNEGESRDSLNFECMKTRNDSSFHFESEIDWPTLKISPNLNYYSLEKVDTTAERPKSNDDLKST